MLSEDEFAIAKSEEFDIEIMTTRIMVLVGKARQDNTRLMHPLWDYMNQMRTTQVLGHSRHRRTVRINIT